MGLDYVDLFLAHFPCAIKSHGDLSMARNFVGATVADQRAAADDRGSYIPDIKHCPSAVARLNGGQGSFVPTWEAMKALVRKGKCRAIGVSNFEREHIEEILPYAAHFDVPISCNQIEAHPWYPNTELIEFLHQNGILPTIYSPFAPRKFRVVNGAVLDEVFMPRGVILLKEPTIRDVASRNAMDVGHVLQSWAVQRRTIPLAKSQNKKRIISNQAVKRLSNFDMEALDSIAMKGSEGKCVDINLLFPGVLMRENDEKSMTSR